ncbi:hydrogenase assembly protein HupF [Mycobacterium sp. UM_Kg1]|uniref:hydrogenase assembly protein HupF n=1 Tax=Mycobacterium sp. UM_Kg1 TaxID=1545691 RepID=UPI00061AA8EE|nr:hydrogenase assembly protein HupF [Mycobacterium sp. UM_Kg1]
MTTATHGSDLAADLACAAFALATRFAAGATMWSVAPESEPHALHIAVEFVHPVVIGKRALPAVALTGHDLVDQLRLSVRSGDVVIAVAGADHEQVRAVMRRGPAWGATTVWIGNGQRPPAGAADHVLWLTEHDPAAATSGAYVLLYHLLWELTHVCFEHPGPLTPARPSGDVCLTCSDHADLGEVISQTTGDTATVRTAAGNRTVVTTPVGPLTSGELVLIHAGTAIGRPAYEEPRP